MKSLRINILVIFLGLMLLACERDFETINTNPNAISDMDPAYLFSNAVKKTFRDNVIGYKEYLFFGSQYAHFYMVPNNNARPHDMYRGYFYTDDYFNTINDSYTGPLKLSNEVIRLCGEEPYYNELRRSLGEVVAVCSYMKMTDLYGEMPYIEGGWGQTGILLPKYDAQSFIYEDMLAKLKAAIDVLKSGDPADAFPGFDPLFDNDLESWIRFANSLRLRMAMRIRFVNESLASAVISECMEEDLISQNKENAQIQTFDDPNLYNPWNDYYRDFRWKMSQKLVDWLKSTSDPRLFTWVEPNIHGEYTGIMNGLNEIAWSIVPWDSISNPTEALYARDMPVYYLCAPETKFYAAEAALIGLNPGGDANQLYREGIRLALELWEVDPDSIDLFLSNEAVATLSSELEPALEQIGTQLWLSLAPNFLESYASIRRLGYPLIPQRTDPWLEPGESDGFLPKRFIYPYNESATNSVNLQDAIDRQGPNEISTPVWWDILDR
jgi:hypothetical protein